MEHKEQTIVLDESGHECGRFDQGYERNSTINVKYANTSDGKGKEGPSHNNEHCLYLTQS